LPKKDLSQILPNPAYKYLLANGANVLLRQPIKAVIYDDHKCIGVTNEQGSWYADNIVLATPPSITAKLLTNKKSLPIATNLSKITYNIITTIYLIFAKPVCLPYLIIGLLDQPAQWIFDRKFVGQPNIVSAIITHNINIPKYTKDELIPAIITQLNKHFPSLPKLVNAKGIQEKRAAFICTPMSQQLRPTHVSGISNLFLTGDYIGNYPATIEGAVRSGINCSQGILGAAAPTTPL
jgi:predicted NAD/FAD-dependent oxidoreductase